MHALRSSTRGQIKGLGQHPQAWRSLRALTLDTTYADLSCHSPQQGSTHTSPPPGWHTGDTCRPQRAQLEAGCGHCQHALHTPLAPGSHMSDNSSNNTYPAGEEALHALAVEVALEPHHQPYPGLRQLIRRQGNLVPLNTVPAVSNTHIWAAPWPPRARLESREPGAPQPTRCMSGWVAVGWAMLDEAPVAGLLMCMLVAGARAMFCPEWTHGTVTTACGSLESISDFV